MDIRQLSQQIIQTCRQRNWAAFDSGLSRPVPVIVTGQTHLRFLLYRSQVKPPHQWLYEPFMQLEVDYETGEIVEHHSLPTSNPPQVLGRYPHAEAARVPSGDWAKVWDELFALYPLVIAAYEALASAERRDQIKRFADLLDLTTPPYLKGAYQALNPAFFEWLSRA